MTSHDPPEPGGAEDHHLTVWVSEPAGTQPTQPTALHHPGAIQHTLLWLLKLNTHTENCQHCTYILYMYVEIAACGKLHVGLNVSSSQLHQLTAALTVRIIIIRIRTLH